MHYLTNEKPIITTRQHWSVILPGIVGFIIAALVILFVVHILPPTLAGHSVRGAENVIVLIVIIALLLTVAVHWLRWRMAEYILTDHRIILTEGVISRVTESITLDRVQDVTVRQGLADRMLQRGNVEIESAGRDGAEILAKVPHPDAFYAQVMEAIDARRNAPAAATPAPAPQEHDSV